MCQHKFHMLMLMNEQLVLACTVSMVRVFSSCTGTDTQYLYWGIPTFIPVKILVLFI